MALAALYNVPITTADLAQWGFEHAAHHRDIIRFVQEQKRLILVEYPLEQINPDNTGIWAYQHQVMHDQMDRVLGIAGYDLIGVDWHDRRLLDEWLQSHASEHLQANALLGIS